MADYVERLDALKELALLDTGEEEYTDNISRTRATIAISNIPAADVAPVVHGEWEDKEVIHKRCIEEWQSARCSACGKYHTTPYMYYFDDFKFCPNCGAKMGRERSEKYGNK